MFLKMFQIKKIIILVHFHLGVNDVSDCDISMEIALPVKYWKPLVSWSAHISESMCYLRWSWGGCNLSTSSLFHTWKNENLRPMAEGKTGGWPGKERAVTATMLSSSSPAGSLTDHVPIADWKTHSSRHSNGKVTGKLQIQPS